ncbi:acetylcholinesterase-1-like [Amblyomma americanum]
MATAEAGFETASTPSPASERSRSPSNKGHHKGRKDENKLRQVDRPAHVAGSERRTPNKPDASPTSELPPPVSKNNPQQRATEFFLMGSYAMCAAIVVLCLVALVEVLTAVRDDPALSTSSGILVGSRLHTSSGRTVHQFLGVPYGLDTSGQRRFADPEALGRFPGDMYRALTEGSPCTQWVNGSVWGSEDCLRLSLWAPSGGDGRSRKSVVFALTGNWFQTGHTASDGAVNWAELAAATGAVVVAPNHRLGVFGFLNAGVRGLLGNVAQEDLLLALSWIKSNSAALNIDPQDVSAFGIGSGAYLLSVILMSSDASETVFRRAFLQGCSRQ